MGTTTFGIRRTSHVHDLTLTVQNLEARLSARQAIADASHDLNVAPSRGARRLLLIYDLLANPFALGDVLFIQVAGLALRDKHKLGAIDFALVYDAQRPTCSDPAFSHIQPHHVHNYLPSLIAAARFSPHHGSLYVFNNHDGLRRFLKARGDHYQMWPGPDKLRGRVYLYYHVFNKIVHDYYLRHGHAPFLTCRPDLANWAARFYREHADSQIPVTVHLRRNANYHGYRNSSTDEWLRFFLHCQGRYPARFILVGSRCEVDPRMRDLDNVIVAKDLNTTAEQDFALVQTARAHLGASSGPASVAIFNDKPYAIVNSDVRPESYVDLRWDGEKYHFAFAHPKQWLFPCRETGELLEKVFDNIWTAGVTRT